MNPSPKWCPSCQRHIEQPTLHGFSTERSLWDAGYCYKCGRQFALPETTPVESPAETTPIEPPAEATPVEPLSFSKQVSAVINAAENSLAAVLVHFGFQEIDPLEFEELVRRIFQAIGFQSQLTPASGDEGIDVEIRSPSGAFGIVQCKGCDRSIPSVLCR